MNRAVEFRFPRLKAWQWCGLVVAGAAAAVVAWVVLREVDWPALVAQLKDRPLMFFSALAVLPAFGAPMSPFYLGAGAAFPLPVAMGGTVAAMSVNMAVSYLLARWLVQPLIVRLARRLGYSVPQFRREHWWMATLLVRITPGPPFFMQHYLLALGRVPFGIYMAVSVPVCALMAAGAVAVGAGLTSGSVLHLFAALGVMAAIVIGVRLARGALQRRSKLRVGAHGEVEPAPGGVPDPGK